jgi:hypothetical protein
MLIFGVRTMRRSIIVSLVVALACLAATATRESERLGENEARQAALQVGRALKQGDPSLLRSVLPARGNVRLRLQVLGPEDGSFSPSQVEALLQDFFRTGSARSFDLLSVEHDPQRYALARGRAMLTDRQGRPARVDLHLAFQPEDGRWVVREIRETRP